MDFFQYFLILFDIFDVIYGKLKFNVKIYFEIKGILFKEL